ncbi:acyltransferase family protein, partial [Ewingella americana]|uniref:acyltransferase family protein n=1 Tax=Ewingella americana TaxID=41202 RepID=UPI0012AE3C65
MIFTIHYIRGIAALLVVLFHFRADLNKVYSQQDLGDLLFGSGMSGVDLFFIISGFIIVLSTKNKENKIGVKFILRRFFRIYPLLIISVLAFWMLMTDWSNLNLLIKSIAPLQLDYTESSPYFGYNLLNPAWTLTYEIYFYAVFCISMLLSHKYRALICSLVMISVMLLMQYYHGGVFIDANRAINIAGNSAVVGILKISASPMLIEFAIGMMIAEFYDRIPYRNVEGNSWLILAFGMSIYFILFSSKAYFTHGVMGFGVWALFLIIPALIYEKTNEIKPSKFLN